MNFGIRERLATLGPAGENHRASPRLDFEKSRENPAEWEKKFCN
jgi:hypothetical protein